MQLLCTLVLTLLLKCGKCEQEEETAAQLHFIEGIRAQTNFSTLLFLRHSQQCLQLEDSLISGLQVPRILLTEQQKVYVRGSYNSNLLAVVCMENLPEYGLLQTLAINLNHMRATKVLLLLQAAESDEVETLLRGMLKFCELQSMLNVVAVFRSFGQSGNYFSYRKFAHFRLEKLNYFNGSKLQPIYAYRLRNLLGYGIRTLPDDTEPRTIVYVDALGQTHVTGCIWLILQALAHRLNASLVLPHAIKPGRIFYNDLLKFTRNATIDIAAGVTGPLYRAGTNEYSYPPYFLTWCLMLPVEWQIPSRDILLLLTCSAMTAAVLILEMCFSLMICLTLQLLEHVGPTSLLDLLLHSSSVRGVLGQSFPFPHDAKLTLRIICIGLFITGLFYSNVYAASLNAFLTRPPLSKRISSLAELQQSPLRILIYAAELATLPAELRARYGKVFNVSADFALVARTRDTLNPSYAFMVPSDRWLVYDEQQRLFARRLFRLSDICLMNWTYANMMFQENSIYHEVLDDTIHRLNAGGLIQQWLKLSFYFMVQADRVTHDDWSTASGFEAVKLQDFYWIWLCYFVLMAVCCLCFVVELTKRYIGRRFHGFGK